MSPVQLHALSSLAVGYVPYALLPLVLYFGSLPALLGVLFARPPIPPCPSGRGFTFTMFEAATPANHSAGPSLARGRFCSGMPLRNYCRLWGGRPAAGLPNIPRCCSPTSSCSRTPRGLRVSAPPSWRGLQGRIGISACEMYTFVAWSTPCRLALAAGEAPLIGRGHPMISLKNVSQWTHFQVLTTALRVARGEVVSFAALGQLQVPLSVRKRLEPFRRRYHCRASRAPEDTCRSCARASHCCS